MEDIITLFEKAEEQLGKRAANIFYKYRDHFLHGDESYCEFEIYADGVDIKWKGGGYYTGTLYIPRDVFCGDWCARVQEQIDADIKKKKARAALTAKLTEESEREQLLKLSAKYN